MTTPDLSPGFLDATRTSYDAMAPAYVDFVRGELAAKPLERALLSTFAELVATGAAASPWPMSAAERAG